MKALNLIIMIALVYFGVTVFYALMQRSFIYYPQTIGRDAAIARVAELGGEPWLSADNEWLGWRLITGGAARRVLVMHGNAGQAIHRRYWAEVFMAFEASGPWDVYVLEYPGYGPRPGPSTEETLRAAALRAMDVLQADRSTPVVLLGESLGGGVAAHVIAEQSQNVAGLLLMTPFSSLVEAARHHLPFLPVSWLLRDRFNTQQLLAEYEGPLVVITGSDDRVVPEHLAMPLIQSHQGPVRHWSQKGADHNYMDLDPRSDGWQKIDEFLADHLPKTQFESE